VHKDLGLLALLLLSKAKAVRHDQAKEIVVGGRGGREGGEGGILTEEKGWTTHLQSNRRSGET
jgi:hypothetical protein